jgi:predicted Fe-Mo cluster-binding NifX family protein
MIIAIPSTDKNTYSLVDDRFGRCICFCIYNSESKEVEFIDNEFASGEGGVGPKVAELLGNKGVNVVYSFEVGPKALNVLETLNIKIVNIEKTCKVSDIIDEISV